MKCVDCKKTIDDESKFCEHCGAKVSRDGDLSKIIEHLEFLGFEVEKSDANSNYLATHKTKSNILFTYDESIGLSICSFFNLDEKKVKKNRVDLLETINRMNNTTIVISFSLNKANGLACSSWFPPTYTKKLFSDFLDLYESDMQRRFKDNDYLKDFS